MTILRVIWRYHAVGIHVSQVVKTAIIQSNGRVYLSVHLRMSLFGTVFSCFGTVWHCLALFWDWFMGPGTEIWYLGLRYGYLGLRYGTRDMGPWIWDPGYEALDPGYEALDPGYEASGPGYTMGWALAIPDCPCRGIPLHHPGYTSPHRAPYVHGAHRCQHPAQRLALSVKTVVSG